MKLMDVYRWVNKVNECIDKRSKQMLLTRLKYGGGVYYGYINMIYVTESEDEDSDDYFISFRLYENKRTKLYNFNIKYVKSFMTDNHCIWIINDNKLDNIIIMEQDSFFKKYNYDIDETNFDVIDNLILFSKNVKGECV